MTSERMKKVILGIAIVSSALLAINSLIFRQVFKEDYVRFHAVKPGMSETEVVALLGQPYRIYEKTTAPKNYYVEGYAFKERSITNIVFIYIGAEPIAYIYFDDKSRVEDTFVGGS